MDILRGCVVPSRVRSPSSTSARRPHCRCLLPWRAFRVLGGAQGGAGLSRGRSRRQLAFRVTTGSSWCRSHWLGRGVPCCLTSARVMIGDRRRKIRTLVRRLSSSLCHALDHVRLSFAAGLTVVPSPRNAVCCRRSRPDVLIRPAPVLERWHLGARGVASPPGALGRRRAAATASALLHVRPSSCSSATAGRHRQWEDGELRFRRCRSRACSSPPVLDKGRPAMAAGTGCRARGWVAVSMLPDNHAWNCAGRRTDHRME